MYVFNHAPESVDFDALANHLATAPDGAMHPALCRKRDKIIELLRAVAARGSVEEADRAIYHAMRLLVYR